jgi:hypothetical protein
MLVYILSGLMTLLVAWNIVVTLHVRDTRQETLCIHVDCKGLAEKIEQFLDADAHRRAQEAQWRKEAEEQMKREGAEWERMQHALTSQPGVTLPGTEVKMSGILRPSPEQKAPAERTRQEGKARAERLRESLQHKK